jgi:hypothetical protein
VQAAQSHPIRRAGAMRYDERELVAPSRMPRHHLVAVAPPARAPRSRISTLWPSTDEKRTRQSKRPCARASGSTPGRRRFQRAIRIDRTRLFVVRKDAARPAEHAVFRRHAMVSRHAVLNLDIVTDANIRVSGHALAQMQLRPKTAPSRTWQYGRIMTPSFTAALRETSGVGCAKQWSFVRAPILCEFLRDLDGQEIFRQNCAPAVARSTSWQVS